MASGDELSRYGNHGIRWDTVSAYKVGSRGITVWFAGGPPLGVEITDEGAEELMKEHGISPHVPTPTVEGSSAMYGKGKVSPPGS